MVRKKKQSQRDIESYAHQGKERVNNPPVGLVTGERDPDLEPKCYEHDPHIDPQLNWAGKKEGTSFEVPTVSLHVHERIDPRTIIEVVRKKNDAGSLMPLFEQEEENPPLRHAIDFYKHRHNWSNRMIAGDSLLVMNSLLEKEGLGGKVQTAYIDPPYGIRYGSNFQPFVNQHAAASTDNDKALTGEPEQIRAFRDTWEMGIHSYLTYLRDRLFLTRELLNETGSCFVQIGKENVHRVSTLMDEVFGAENRIATISYSTTGSSSTNLLPEVANYLLWYGKNKLQVKYRQLYESLNRQEIVDYMSSYVMVEEGGCSRLMAPDEKTNPNLLKNARIFQRSSLTSIGVSTTGRSEPYEWNGTVYPCPKGRQWSVDMDGLDNLASINRLVARPGGELRLKVYEDEVPGRKIHNVWAKQMSANNKRYVVQTADSVVQRCILMTSSPGDLVFDPTCGSGTTAAVAEQWGRRWITCDTSRVAIAIARQRLMTSTYDYYMLAYPDEGVGSDFAYNCVETHSAETLAYNKPAKQVHLYDKAFIDKNKLRVSGPFTVEAVPAPTVIPVQDLTSETQIDADIAIVRTDPTLQHSEWREELLRTGIRGKSGQRMSFIRLEPQKGTKWLHAEGEVTPYSVNAETVPNSQNNNMNPDVTHRVFVSFGPKHAPLEQRQVELAMEEAQKLVPKPDMIVFAAFQFDPEAAKDIDETISPGQPLLKAQMNADMLTYDLKKGKSSNDSFWLIGQPDIRVMKAVEENQNKYSVKVEGFDYYDMLSGTVVSGGSEKIAIWMLDTDYDGRSLYPRQIFFPMSGEADGWQKLAKTLKGEIDEDRIKYYCGTQSIPFDKGDNARVAVKIVDDRGVESLKVKDLD